MKRVSSVVWQFFDRLEENNRCVSVLCKLCDSEYRYFGNTTNLRAHLIKKHPLQWEFRQNNLDNQKSLDESNTQQYEDDNSKRRKIVSVEVLEHSETNHDQGDVDEDSTTLNLVRQMHDTHGSDEEWLEEDYGQLEMFEPSHKKAYKKIKREVVTPPRRSSTFVTPSKKSSKPERIIVNNSPKDEYSVFGEYIANKLRKFKAPRTRGNIQQIITTILWQAEYGLYDDAEAVKRVLLSSVQSDTHTQHSSAPDSGNHMPSEPFEPEKIVEEELDQNCAY